ncbi:MAG TPA: hypothetical protein VF975_04410 [Thermoanaerobaculia bacterium]
MSRHLAFCAFLLLVACSHKTPDQQLLEEADPLASWAATLQFAGEQWLANGVPTSFVRATAGAAEKAFEKTNKAISESHARQELRHAITQQLDIMHAAARDLKQAIEKNDRRTVAESVKRLAAVSAALQKLEEQKDRS